MKIIISRKGFDSKNGGCPSPIFPDGSLVSMPIPVRQAPVRYCDVVYKNQPLSEIAASLSGGMVMPTDPTHLDPDLNSSHIARRAGWLPAFGQSGTAQSHLALSGVTVGDLFLFFGWFRQVELIQGEWRYQRKAPHQHVLFGWLQVGEILKIGSDLEPFKRSHPWLSDHPHLHGNQSAQNTIYIATKSLSLPNLAKEIPGGGTFPTALPVQVLTAPGQPNRSLWRMPDCFEPTNRTPLTYHSAPSRWSRSPAGHLHLQSVAIGQEFVLDTKLYPDAVTWTKSLFAESKE
jgi:hypothetical protein